MTDMAGLGKLTTVATLAIVAAALVLGIRSVPDVKRYLRMRSM